VLGSGYPTLSCELVHIMALHSPHILKSNLV